MAGVGLWSKNDTVFSNQRTDKIYHSFGSLSAYANSAEYFTGESHQLRLEHCLVGK